MNLRSNGMKYMQYNILWVLNVMLQITHNGRDKATQLFKILYSAEVTMLFKHIASIYTYCLENLSFNEASLHFLRFENMQKPNMKYNCFFPTLYFTLSSQWYLNILKGCKGGMYNIQSGNQPQEHPWGCTLIVQQNTILSAWKKILLFRVHIVTVLYET